MARRCTITVERDDEVLAALDWDNDAPAGMQIARAHIRPILKGMLEVDFAAILLKYRAAAQQQRRDFRNRK